MGRIELEAIPECQCHEQGVADLFFGRSPHPAVVASFVFISVHCPQQQGHLAMVGAGELKGCAGARQQTRALK